MRTAFTPLWNCISLWWA